MKANIQPGVYDYPDVLGQGTWRLVGHYIAPNQPAPSWSGTNSLTGEVITAKTMADVKRAIIGGYLRDIAEGREAMKTLALIAEMAKGSAK